jgi:hypothetical protein
VAERGVELLTKGESFSLKTLERININIGPVGSAYHGILNEVRSVVRGDKSFSTVYVEGLYGTGKTLALRRAVHDILSGPRKEEYERVIPIYFYLGEMDFTLLQGFKNYVGDVKTHVEGGGELLVKPNIVGWREDWSKRLPVLDLTVTLSWNEEHLGDLAREYGLSLDQNVIRLLSIVLPTPRAIVQIDIKVRSYLGGAPQVVSLKEFYNVIKHGIMSFVERLKKERVDGKPVVGAGARWHERFLKLLENGYFFVHYNTYDKVAEVVRGHGNGRVQAEPVYPCLRLRDRQATRRFTSRHRGGVEEDQGRRDQG